MVEEGQLLPQNIEAERAVLGAVMIDNDAIIDAREHIESYDFYRRSHQLIFDAMIDLSDKSEPIDTLTLSDYLERKQLLEEVGGISYLTELVIGTPSSENIGQYARMIKDTSTLRQLIKVATEIAQKGYSQDEEVDDLLNDASNKIMQVAEHREHQDIKKMSEVIANVAEQTEKLAESTEEVTGLSTGYPMLDKLTTGLHEDELIILAARPGFGKTAFALNVAQNVGTRNRKNTTEKNTVVIFSLEMGAESLVSRMVCSHGMISSKHVRTGQLDSEEWERFYPTIAALGQTNMYIDDTAGIRVSEIRAKCKRIAQENNGIDLIIIDYLQLIEGGTGRESRQQEVSYISRQLKKLAKELHVPIIALSQLSRSVEQRNDKLPMLSDLRESGSIEQDADIVAFLHRDYYERDHEEDEEGSGFDDAAATNDSDSQVVELRIEKNRSGARGQVPLAFIKQYNHFASISPIHE